MADNTGKFWGNQNCPNPAVTVQGLWAGYDNHAVLREIDLCLPRGSLIGMIGPNGSGKSTLIKTIVGLLKPWRGTVAILGHPPSKARTFLGYIPQKSDIDWNFPVSAFDVVLMGTYGRIGLIKRPGRRERDIAMSSLEQVGMGNVAARQIGELSGGQQKRVFLARALTQEPQVLLLDEPVSGVDVISQHTIFELLEGLSEKGVTVLVATHELSHLATRFERLICINHRIMAYSTPEEVLTPGILNETYGAHHLLTVREGGDSFVVD